MAEKEQIEPEAPRAGPRTDAELEAYRSLMDVPEAFEDGFSKRTVIGALFVCLVMMPASIYLGLLTGTTLGGAAEWVTVILFTEVARRSFMRLSKQEVYILIYVAGSLVAGGPFGDLVWKQYLAQSAAAKGFQIADKIPTWVVPHPGSLGIINRTFLHPDWLIPIGLVVLGQLISRLQWFGLGYLLFKVTSDIERLPFPFAPIAAQGATALAEHTQKQESWRWHVFSTGAVIGLAWAGFYVFVPALSGAVLSKPIQLITIPWIDLTTRTERILPGVPTGIATDLGSFLGGFIIPFWGVVGAAGASAVTFIVNPWLVRSGNMPNWEPGMDTIQTSFAAWRDYWLPATIGVLLAISLIGFFEMGKSIYYRKRAGAARRTDDIRIAGRRGDIPIVLAAGLYLVSVAILIFICRVLIPGFPLWWLLFFGFLYTPLMSYVSARLMGLIGQSIDIPMIKEVSFIVSGYKGIDIWYAPIPIGNMGGQAQFFRSVELTGTKLKSVIKAEVLMFPLIMFFSFLFWQYIWKLAPIPSNAYPYAQKLWPLRALGDCLWQTATLEDNRFFYEAVFAHEKQMVILYWGGAAIVGYTFMAVLRLPTMFIFGFLRGLSSMPHYTVLTLAGALLSRYYFEPRYGWKQWKLWMPVMLVGFATGMGLVGMAGAALAMVIKSVKQFPY